LDKICTYQHLVLIKIQILYGNANTYVCLGINIRI